MHLFVDTFVDTSRKAQLLAAVPRRAIGRDGRPVICAIGVVVVCCCRPRDVVACCKHSAGLRPARASVAASGLCRTRHVNIRVDEAAGEGRLDVAIGWGAGRATEPHSVMPRAEVAVGHPIADGVEQRRGAERACTEHDDMAALDHSVSITVCRPRRA
jgi:hypothetical protein